VTHIVVTEFMDAAAIGALRAAHPVHYDPELCDVPDRLCAALSAARALIVRNRTVVDAALLAHGPGLRVVGRLGAGVDNIDLAACRERGIEVIPATGANADSVAEYVFLAVGSLLRGAFAATAEAGVLVTPAFMPEPVSGHPKKGYVQMRQILSLGKTERPTAVVAVGDKTAKPV